MPVCRIQRVLKMFLPQLSGAGHVDIHGAAAATTMRAFDGAAIAPMMGLRDAAEYYAEVHTATCHMAHVHVHVRVRVRVHVHVHVHVTWWCRGMLWRARR